MTMIMHIEKLNDGRFSKVNIRIIITNSQDVGIKY